MSADLVGPQRVEPTANPEVLARESALDAEPERLRLYCGAALWLVLVAFGLGSLMAYANRPGDPGLPMANWPEDPSLMYSSTQPTLMLFAHPKCPCTLATLDELSWVLTRSTTVVDCRVLFYQPKDAGPEWSDTQSWNVAKGMKGVRAMADIESRIAHRFGVKTSGHVLLYDQQGKLAFQGGITSARGHRGDNPGRASLLALLTQSPSTTSLAATGMPAESTCVFGCPLHTPNSALLLNSLAAEER